MKVLVIGRGVPSEKNPLLGIFEYDQARALASAGAEVIYAGIDLRSIRRRRKLGIYHTRKDGMEIFSAAFPVGAMGRSVLNFAGRNAFALLYGKIEKQLGRPSLVHAHFGGLGSAAAQLCRKKGLPLVITEHSSSLDADELSENKKRELKKAYSHACAVIAVSSSLKKRIEILTGTKAIVIPDMVNMPEGIPNECDSDIFRFVSAGNLIERKGMDTLLKAFARVSAETENCALTIMGDGAEKKKLLSLAAELGISDRVSFTGKYVRSEFAAELGRSQAFVLASRHETFGVVYIEALYCGRPVIATRCGGPEDIVEPSNGVLVEVDDVDALAGAMLEMIANIHRYDSRQISRRTKALYSPETVAEKLMGVYNSVLDN